MTKSTTFTYVGIHDPKWQIEAVVFTQNEDNLTLAYPRWLIDLLCGTVPTGESISFNKPLGKWFIRQVNQADLLVEEGWYIGRTRYGTFMAKSPEDFDFCYRKFVDDMDSLEPELAL